MILDGWGISPDPSVSAIEQAETPFIDGLYSRYPHAELRTYGMNVGLPDGQMGNSEVGHMNLGAGRVVYQDLAKINMAVSEHTLGDQPALKDALNFAKANGRNVHFLGLLSDGGVHSHITHLEELLRVAATYGINAFVHAFTDGRDVDPRSGLGFVKQIQEVCGETGARLASVTGRYYAMDRDKRWERVKLAYDAVVHGQGNQVGSIADGVQSSYDEGVTDEFIKPIVQDDGSGKPLATIKDGDVVVFFNFRTDRGRELTMALSQQDFDEHGMKKFDNLKYVTMTRYDDTFTGVDVIYDKENIRDTLGEVLSRHGIPQLRIAETEKYPHVTFFFNGGREEPFEGEDRILIPSPKVATYDLKPEMSAYELRDAVIPELTAKKPSFVCLNFANPDMVGHTGIMEAAIKACEAVDRCVRDIVNTGTENGYSFLIIADHGNCDTMRNPDGSPNTAHTTNPVPIIAVDNHATGIEEGVLGDLAPTVLFLMGVDKPEAMTGKNLVSM